jgi:hypothetical protein
VSFEMSFLNTLAAGGMNQIPDFNSLDHQNHIVVQDVYMVHWHFVLDSVL